MNTKHISFRFKTKSVIAIILLISCFSTNEVASAQSNSTTAGSGSSSSLQEMYAARYGSSSQKNRAQSTDGPRYSINPGAPPVVTPTTPLDKNQSFYNFNNRPPIDSTSTYQRAPESNRRPIFNRAPVQTNKFAQTSSSIGQLGGGDFPLPPASDEVEQFRIPQLDALIMTSAYKQNRIDGSLTPPPGYKAPAQNRSKYR